MSDGQCIPPLLKIASDPNELVAAQHIAAMRLLNYDGEIFPATDVLASCFPIVETGVGGEPVRMLD